MRKVELTEYFYPGGKKTVKGIAPGLFHGWGFDYEEFENGPGNYSIAIVEMGDGSIKTCVPENIKFID